MFRYHIALFIIPVLLILSEKDGNTRQQDHHIEDDLDNGFRYDQIQLHPQDGACQASYTETDAKGDIQVPCLFIVHRAKGA